MFNNNYVVRLKDYVENEYAHNPEDGERIANLILDNYKGDREIIIDFKGIDTINTAFANKIIDALYKKYGMSILDKYLSIKNHNELIQMTINRVIENIKE